MRTVCGQHQQYVSPACKPNVPKTAFECRVNQDSLLRFTEVGWQVWNLWAKPLFVSCASEKFYPLGTISDEEWEAEWDRVNNIRDENIRKAQAENLIQVKEVRDAEAQRY